MSESEVSADPLDQPVESLGTMSIRLHNVLTRPTHHGFTTVRQVTQMTEPQFLRMYDCGRKSLEELKLILADRGLALAETESRKTRTAYLPFPTLHERLRRIEQRLDRLERSTAVGEESTDRRERAGTPGEHQDR